MVSPPGLLSRSVAAPSKSGISSVNPSTRKRSLCSAVRASISFLQFLIFSTDDDGLEFPVELKQPADDRGGRAEAEGSTGDEQRRFCRIQAVALEHGLAIHRYGEFRLDGNAGDVNPVARKAETFHVDPVLLLRDKIPMERACDPEGMEMVIGHDDAQLGFQAAKADEKGQDAGRHEVRANYRIGLEVADEVNKRKSLRKIECEPALVGDPWVIARNVPPSEKLGEHGGKALVKRRIELLVQNIGVIERVVHQHLLNVGPCAKRLRQRLRRLDVPGTNGR